MMTERKSDLDTVLRIAGHLAFLRDGALVCEDCPIASLGGRVYSASEMKEIRPDGRGRVTLFRDAETLFAPETIRSFEAKPLTLGHPPEGFLTPESWGRYAVGDVRNVHRGAGKYADCLMADLVIREQAAIQAVLDGTATELSCGFVSKAKDIGGGCGVEKGILGNHVALVDHGRCGALVAIRRDHKPTGGDMSIFKRDEEPAPETGATSADMTEILSGLSEKIEALAERIAALEAAAATPATDEETIPAAEEKPEEKQDDETSEAVTPEAVKAIVEEALAKDRADRKTDAAVVADAAALAPALSSETPDLARAALAEYGKTARGSAFLAAVGGLGAVKGDRAATALHNAVLFERLREREPLAVKIDAAPAPATDFFKRAKALWK